MTFETFFTLSGLSLAIGGILATVGWLLFAFVDPGHQQFEHRSWLTLNLLIIAGGVFMALGLPGFYLYQAEQSGILGLIGFVVLFVGIVIPYIAVHSIETATAPNIPPLMRLWVSVGAPSLFIGMIIMGIATWRADVYPQAAGVLLTLSVFIGLFTTVRSIPSVLRRGVIPAILTITMTMLGILLMSQ